MATTQMKDVTVKLVGELPVVGSVAPDFTLADSTMTDRSLAEFRGKSVVMSIFPTLDTGVCAASIRRFNEEAARHENAVVLCISADLPLAHKRFCAAEGIENVVTLSTFRNAEFGDVYGVRMKNGGFAGLMARSVIVLDATGRVVYTELVPAVGQEPNYEAAMAAIS